jgi:hypothetical protein
MLQFRTATFLLLLVLSLVPTGLRAGSSAFRSDGRFTDITAEGRSREAARQPDPATMPRYTLTIDVDPTARRLKGSMTLVYTNRTGTALRSLVLRLYPNFPPDIFGDGGTVRMELADTRVNGTPATFTYEAQRTAALIPLPTALQPGAEVRLDLSWSVGFVAWSRADGSFPLPSYYPMLAAWTGDWRQDVTRFPDRVFTTAAIYRASISVPSGWTVLASGSTTGTRQENGKSIHDIVTGPIREFAFSVGRFAVARASHAGIAVNAYHKPGDGLEAAARNVALHAAASLAVFGDRFGAYPYNELDLHLINARRGFDAGVEYPGLIFLLVNGRYSDDTRFVTAHEVAHQWWYGVVGNDIYREPWIDEAFAQWSALLVEEHYAGPAATDRVYQRHIVRLAQRTRVPAGLPITAYGNWNTYYAAVYGRGAQFLYTLRRELGDDAFFRGLRRYYADNQHGIGTTAKVRMALEQSSGRDLGPLFKQWIGQ